MIWGRKTTARERVREARDSRGVVARPLCVSVIFRCVLCAFLVFVLICQPYTISAKGWQIEVQKQEAQAVPAAIPFALGFLQACADAAGLTLGEYVATQAIIICATTGFIALDQAVDLKAADDLQTLAAVRETAEWPSWENLDSETQASWGNEKKYQAAQWNSYADAFGLGEARDTWYSDASGGTGGGTVDDLDDQTKSELQKIGEVAEQWKSGNSVSIDTLKDILGIPRMVFNPKTGVQLDKSYDGHKIRYTYIDVGTYQGTYIGAETWCSGRLNPQSNYSWSVAIQDNANTAPVDLVWSDTYNAWQVSVSSSSKSGKSYSYNKDTSKLIRSNVANVITAEFGSNSRVNFELEPERTCNLIYPSYNVMIGNNQPSQVTTETNPASMPYAQILPDTYPGDYVKADTLSPNQSWPSLFTDEAPIVPPEPVVRPETPFNPDNQSGSEEFDEQAQSVFIPLIQLPFDKMFPFCVIWDIGKLMDKMYELGGVGSVSADQSTSLRSVYAQRDGLQVQGDRGDVDLSIPGKPEWTQGHTEIVADLSQFGIPGTEGMTLMVDVWPLAVLLSYIRPFLQMLFIAGLLYVTILTFRMFIFNG